MDALTQQSTGDNVPSGEIRKDATNIMEQSKPAPLIEYQPKPTSSSENPLKPTTLLDQPESKLTAAVLHSTSFEHELKPSEEKLLNEDVNKNFPNVEDLNKTKKVNSWASNYLQSIGHNNIKPIKITLTSGRNKLQRIETISTTSNESNITIAQSTLLKDVTSSYEVFNMPDSPFEFSKPNKNIISEHINVGNIKTLHPTNVTADVHPKVTPASSRSDNIITDPVTSNILLDKILYTNNNNNSIAPAYASLFANGSGESTNCYNDGKREIDILDSIKSKIDHESAIEKKTRLMNLPTHKDMCEEFIKEISCNKPSASERMRDRSKSSTPAKKEELVPKNKKDTEKHEKKAKNLTKKDKKDSLKIIKKKTSDKERENKSKSSSSEKDKAVAKKKKVDQQYKKQQIRKPVVDLKDFDILTKHIFAKEAERLPKTENHSPERKNLKRVRDSSDDQHNLKSEIHTQSPIRSVIKVAENGPSNSPKRQCLDESFDLRSKLSRVNQRIHRKQMENDLNTKPKQRENLKITVENQIDEKLKSPRKSSVLKYNKCKKLKLIINVVCQESDDETTSSDSSHNETPTHNIDLSFLDDFNVDEIVDSLKHSPNNHLSNDNKIEENTKMTAEPERKLATILNILHAKSETNKLRTLAKTECKIEETMKISSPPICNKSEPSTVLDVDMYGIRKAEENTKKMNTTDNTNITHALVKILSPKLQMNEQKTAPFDEVPLEAKCELQTEKFNVISTQKEIQQIDDSERSIMDESVIIDEPEICIIDLTDETVCAASKTNNIAITDLSNYIPSAKQGSKNKLVGEETVEANNVHQSGNVHKDKNENLSNYKKYIEEKNNNLAKKVYEMDVDIEKAILDQNNESIIDLTNETIEGEIDEGIEHKNANTQMDIGIESIMKQKIHLIPLPNSDISPSKENKEPIKTKIYYNHKKIPKDTEKVKEKPNEIVEVVSPTNDVSKNTNAKPTIATKPGSIVVRHDTEMVRKESNIENKEDRPQEIVKNVSKGNGGNTPIKENKNTNKIIETNAAKKILKTIVEKVWDTNNYLPLETSNDTNAEPEKSKTNRIVKKVTNESNLTAQHEALAVLLEERMLDYLRKEIKIIKHIHLGKYSNIYSCKDSNGEIYAAKMLINQSNRHNLGIQKEEMLKQIQKDIPRENLNTIYLIDGFGVDRYWCFLTEYYPKNLLQALKVNDKPFHVDRVQDLARQLISAVMVLRNNGIIHSDIKPTHILLNSTNDRLKLCGFDEAFNGNDYVNLVPSIGSVNYRAPEIIIGFSSGYSIDVWSSALVIYQMATNKRLFPGIFNNDILYKQMCTLGNLPPDMVEASYYKNHHFQGRTFMRRVGFKGQDAVLIQKFIRTKRLQKSIFVAYDKYWRTKDAFQRDSDMYKLSALHNLLEQMLVLDPRLRLAIEFVCADPFIYESF